MILDGAYVHANGYYERGYWLDDGTFWALWGTASSDRRAPSSSDRRTQVSSPEIVRSDLVAQDEAGRIELSNRPRRSI